MGKKQKVLVLVSLSFILGAALVLGTNAFFTHLTITDASNQCYDQGGLPKVEKDLLGVHYSFTCDM